jgi:uncharacterized protein
MSGEALGVDAILRRADIPHEYKENVGVQHVVFGFRDLALLLHNTGHRGAKVLDEHLTTVCLHPSGAAPGGLGELHRALTPRQN